MKNNTIDYKKYAVSPKIDLRTKYNTIVNGYQPSIIRPFDSVSVPRDLKRDTFGNSTDEKCNWPCYAGSNFQEWCSEKDAIWYHAMQPIIEPNEYNNLLLQMFELVVGKKQEYMTIPNIPLEEYSSIFCTTNTKDVMKHIMDKVAIAVSKMPKFNKNSTWGSEQFHYTDEKFYVGYLKQQNKQQMYYNIIFNLYNPLRSISTLVHVIVEMINNTKPVIIYMNFVNNGTWKQDGSMTKQQDGISSFNDLYSGISTNYNDPAPTEVEWNYGNTLLDQEFNKYGFYDNDKSQNIKINDTDGLVPNNLKFEIKHIEGNYNSYLMGCGTPAYNGVINPDPYNPNKVQVLPNNGRIRTPNANPQVVFETPLQIDKKGSLVSNNKSYPVGFIYT